jgi:hypothetical protein
MSENYFGYDPTKNQDDDGEYLHHLEQSQENQDQFHQEVSVENLDEDIVENHP